MIRWVILVVLFAILLGANYYFDRASKPEEPHVENLTIPEEPKLTQGSMEPGRVVVLHTSKGIIEFVLFEKDCPENTKRIADLVSQGKYDGVEFVDVIKNAQVITGDAFASGLLPVPCEGKPNIHNEKGAVGMNRTGSDIDSAISSFYINLEPQPQKDISYTVFGRVIRGMDVVAKLQKGDKIKRAKLRDSNDKDRKKLAEQLAIAVRRKVDAGPDLPMHSSDEMSERDPGKVLVLNTTKGAIEVALFEKDCPVTVKRIEELVAEGIYNNMDFDRVENSLIQAGQMTTIQKAGLPLEIKANLNNIAGTVGMARLDSDLRSGRGSFYILRLPLKQIDGKYTVFGIVTKGMDVVKKIQRYDKIKNASIRPATNTDKIVVEKVYKKVRLN